MFAMPFLLTFFHTKVGTPLSRKENAGVTKVTKRFAALLWPASSDAVLSQIEMPDHF